MTAEDAQAYLTLRLQSVYDRLGGKQKVAWSGRDAEAVQALLREAAGRRL